MFPGGSPWVSLYLRASIQMMKMAPKNWPPTHKILEDTAGETGEVCSGMSSRKVGSSANDDAPRMAQTTKGPASWSSPSLVDMKMAPM